MLKTNLSVLLAERNLKITKVAEDTGISRTTLTSLSYNNSQGVQFDTLNKLCIYLQITPEHFFTFLPYEVSVRLEKQTTDFYHIYFYIEEKHKKHEFPANLSVSTSYIDDDSSTSKKKISAIDIEIQLDDPLRYNDSDGYEREFAEKENKLLMKYLCQIPRSHKWDIERFIGNEILDDHIGDPFLDIGDIDINFIWPT